MGPPNRKIRNPLYELSLKTDGAIGYILIDWVPGGYPGKTVILHFQFQHLASMIVGRIQTLMQWKYSASLAWTQNFGSR